MKKTVLILSLLVLLLGGWAAALWLLPFAGYKSNGPETRHGIYEGLELVEQADGEKGKRYVVEDGEGNELFAIPLRNCLIDTRYRNGRLRFRERTSKREGFIDRNGMVSFLDNGNATAIPENNRFVKAAGGSDANQQGNPQAQPTASPNSPSTGPSKPSGKALPQINLKSMAQSNPFYKEASKILQGKVSETDAKRRHQILNYCEHFRTAYTTKDIDFLRQVFSDQALIIVGNVVKGKAGDNQVEATGPRVTYAVHSKRNYISRLSKVFAANQKIEVSFSGFRILRHPTMDGIYGVTLRQQYKSDRYSDDGYLFLLWDFRNPSMPLIHVRTWQPAKSITESNEVIGIQDFNLE